MKTYCGIMAAALAAGSAAAEIVTIDFEDYAPYVGFELSFVQDGVFVTGNSEFRDVDGDIGRGGLVPGAFWSMALYGDRGLPDGQQSQMRLISFTAVDLGGPGVDEGLRVSGVLNDAAVGLTYFNDIGSTPATLSVVELEGMYVDRLFFAGRNSPNFDDYVILSITLDVIPVPTPSAGAALLIAGGVPLARRRRGV